MARYPSWCWQCITMGNCLSHHNESSKSVVTILLQNIAEMLTAARLLSASLDALPMNHGYSLNPIFDTNLYDDGGIRFKISTLWLWPTTRAPSAKQCNLALVQTTGYNDDHRSGIKQWQLFTGIMTNRNYTSHSSWVHGTLLIYLYLKIINSQELY